jgi:hypothetical protein
MNVISERSEVFTAVLLTVEVFWDVTLCRLVNGHRRFEGAWCLHVQGQAIQEENSSWIIYSSILESEPHFSCYCQA